MSRFTYGSPMGANVGCRSVRHSEWQIHFLSEDPRKVAAAYLYALRHGSCAALPADMFEPAARSKDFCDLAGHQLTSWQIRSVTEEKGLVTVGYAVGYDGMASESDPYEVTLKQVGGDWKIETRSTSY